MFENLVRVVNFSGFTKVSRKAIDCLYRQQVIFVHVPKCGGTSLSHMLRARYLLSYAKIEEGASRNACSSLDDSSWFEFKRQLVRYHATKGTHFIQAHFALDDSFLNDHCPRFKIVTVLRDPVDRLLSHYHFDHRYRSVSIDKFLNSPEGARECRVLCHFFGELPWFKNHTESELDKSAMTAMKNIQRLNVVAILEHPRSSDIAFEKCLGFKPRSPKRNVATRTSDVNRGFTTSQVERVRELCNRDMHIYNKMVNKLIDSGRYTKLDTPVASNG